MKDERLSTDSNNQCGLPNYEGFREHRHDQSIFILLTKKCGLLGFRDPSQYGNPVMDLYPHSNYPQLINLTKNCR